MSAVFISSPEAQASMDRSDSNIDLCLETDSASTTIDYHRLPCVSKNRLSYEDLRKQPIEMERALEDSKSKNENLETEVEKVRVHAFNLSEKCSKLENGVFSLDKFLSDEDFAF